MRLLEDLLVFTIVAGAAVYLISVFGPKRKKDNGCGSACPKCSSGDSSAGSSSSFSRAASSAR